MTFARRRLLLGSTAALGAGLLGACTTDESWSDASSSSAGLGDDRSDERSASWSHPGEVVEVLPAAVLLALGDGKVLRHGHGADTVELVQHGAVLWQVGGPGDGPGQFSRITAAAVGADGAFWLVDTGNRRIQVLEPSGEVRAVVGASGAAGAVLRRPVAVAVASDGRSYVADAGRSGVMPFAADGTPGDLIGGFGSGHAFTGVSALQVADDELVVLEALAPRVQVRALDGTWSRSLELPEHANVADLAVGRGAVFLISHDGRLLRSSLWGSTGRDGVQQLGHVGSHARRLHFGDDGLVVTAVAVPNHSMRRS